MPDASASNNRLTRRGRERRSSVPSLAAPLLAIALCAGEPGPLRASTPGMLRFSEGLDVTTLNPLLSTVASSADLAQLTMAHFVKFDRAGRMVPELIETLPTKANHGVSSDGKTITYHLRHGVRWSDGAPFDADDVAFSVAAIRDPANNISIRDAWDRVSGVDERDRYTVTLHLKAPFGSAVSRFFASNTNSCVLPKHLLAGLRTINDAPYNALPVGIGPFRYTAFRRGDAIEMEANPFYFRGLPKLRRIEYKLITVENTLLAQMQTGELDLWGTVGGTWYDRVRAIDSLAVTIVKSAYMSGVYLNTTRPSLRDRDVRRALRIATDRAFVLDEINRGAGTLSESVVAQISQDEVALPLVPFDLAAAGRLLDASGWKTGGDGIRAKGGVRLAMQIALPAGYAPSQSTAELLRANWRKIGIDVETKPYADAQYFAPASAGGTLTSGNFDAALLSLPSLYDADVGAYYGCAYTPPAGLNVDRYCDRDVDRALAAYNASFDPVERRKLAARFQRAIDDASATIVLYERGFIYAYAKSVSGFHPGTFTAYDDFMNVDVDSNGRPS